MVACLAPGQSAAIPAYWNYDNKPPVRYYWRTSMRKVNPPCYAQTQSLLTTWSVSTTMTSWQKPREIGSYAQPVRRIGPQQTRRESPPPTVPPLCGTSSAALSAAPPSRGESQEGQPLE